MGSFGFAYAWLVWGALSSAYLEASRCCIHVLYPTAAVPYMRVVLDAVSAVVGLPGIGPFSCNFGGLVGAVAPVHTSVEVGSRFAWGAGDAVGNRSWKCCSRGPISSLLFRLGRIAAEMYF